MQIGWIDFSEKDRKRAIDVLHLLNEGAVDELGIGVVRDAFADYFFPGTSTIQTRAKYFLIVPYALRTACANCQKGRVQDVVREMERLEKMSAQLMKSKNDQPGIIGASILPKWVLRQPSTIYWNGIRRYNIMTAGQMSMTEVIATELEELRIKRQRRVGHKEGEEGAEDDDRGVMSGNVQVWDSMLNYREDWMDDLNIELTREEASYLRERISSSKSTEKSLIKFLLDNSISVRDICDSSDQHPFAAVTDAVRTSVSDEMADMLRIANLFDILIYSLRVRYNLQMGNVDAIEKWKEVPELAKSLQELNLSDMFHKLKIAGSFQSFLIEAQRLLLAGKYEEIDELILGREIKIKTRKRCKLLQKEKYCETWIGGMWLDYRLMAADNILQDIFNAERGGEYA